MNYLSSPLKDEVATAIALLQTAIERKKAVKVEKKVNQSESSLSVYFKFKVVE